MPSPGAGGEMNGLGPRPKVLWLAAGALSLVGITCGVALAHLTHASPNAGESVAATSELSQGGLSSPRPPAQPWNTSATTSATTSVAAPSSEVNLPDQGVLVPPQAAPAQVVQVPIPLPPVQANPPNPPAPAPMSAAPLAPAPVPSPRIEVSLIPLKPQEPVRPGQLQVG